MPRASWTALVAVAACLLSAAAPAFAADGDLDPEFDYDGVNRFDLSFSPRIAVQPDGRIVVGGNGPPRVGRLTGSGALDGSFDGDGFRTLTPEGGMGLADVALQPDGRILVVGTASENEAPDVVVFRLNTDGSLDTTFDGDGQVRFDFDASSSGASSRGTRLAVQPDGRIVIAGWGSAQSDFTVARLNPDGGIDTTFSGDGRTAEDLGGDLENVQAVVLQGDRIVLAGWSNGVRSTSIFTTRLAALALRPDGTRDTGFGPAGDGTHIAELGPDSLASDVIVTQDGGLLLTGYGTGGPGGYDVAALKLDATGRADAGFSGDGRQLVDFGGGLADFGVAAATTIDGKLAIAGETQSHPDSRRLVIAKLTPDGELDPSFADQGRRVYDSVGPFRTTDLARQPDGRLLAGGTDFGMILVRVGDSLPVASLTAPTIDEGRVAPFTVTLNKTAGYPVSMSFGTGDGSAIAGEDYTGRSGTLTIPAGQSTGVIAVGTTLDRLYEAADEDFRIELDNLVGATFGVRIDHATLRNVLRRGRCANTVIGRRGTDIITGSPAGDRIRGRADADILFGLGGDDCILGERGGDQIRGGDGDDLLEGGSGDDEMKGEDGKDRIVGGRGRNRYSGGAGNDRIYARNGRAEIVECGPGRDYAKVDRTDKLRRCERVARSRG